MEFLVIDAEVMNCALFNVWSKGAKKSREVQVKGHILLAVLESILVN